MSRIKNSFHTYAIITSIFWSLAYCVTRMCSQYFEPVQLSILRCVVAALTLIVVIFIKKLRLPAKKDLKWFVLSGVSGIFLYMVFFNLGCAQVTSATGTVMLAITPVLTAIAARFLFNERLISLQWIAIVISFIGVLVLTILSGGFSVNIGLLWLMIAVLLMAIYNLTQKFLSKKYPSLTITSYSFVIGTICIVFCTPLAFDAVPVVPFKAYLLVIFLGMCCSALAYCSWTKAFSKAKNSSSVSNYMFVNPFMGALFGSILIGDPVESSAIYGGAIIMIGLFLFNFGPGLLKKLKSKEEQK